MPDFLPVVQPGRPFPASTAPPIFDKIGIVGLGLIGGSIALAARQLWPKALVIGVDNKDVLETAMRLHAIDVAADDLIVLAEADLVILAAPVKTNIALLADLDDNVHQPAVVTDTGSTKRGIMEAAGALPPRFTFVGGHPLAGAAQGGLEHARPDLFSGRPWLLTPAVHPEAHGPGIDKLTSFVAALGAVPRLMEVREHDRLLAFLSHLPQLTANRFNMFELRPADTTRLASSPPDIWRDIAATNADQIAPALDELIALLQELRRDLPDGDRLADVFTDAARWRGSLKK